MDIRFQIFDYCYLLVVFTIPLRRGASWVNTASEIMTHDAAALCDSSSRVILAPLSDSLWPFDDIPMVGMPDKNWTNWSVFRFRVQAFRPRFEVGERESALCRTPRFFSSGVTFAPYLISFGPSILISIFGICDENWLDYGRFQSRVQHNSSSRRRRINGCDVDKVTIGNHRIAYFCSRISIFLDADMLYLYSEPLIEID